MIFMVGVPQYKCKRKTLFLQKSLSCSSRGGPDREHIFQLRSRASQDGLLLIHKYILILCLNCTNLEHIVRFMMIQCRSGLTCVGPDVCTTSIGKHSNLKSLRKLLTFSPANERCLDILLDIPERIQHRH